MGSALSCCGLGDDDAAEYSNRHTERTPLLQDPTAVLQQPRPEPTPEDQQRDQEALARIVDRTAENLVNIQSTFDWHKKGQTMDATDKAAHFQYLIDRLQNNGGKIDSKQSHTTENAETHDTAGPEHDAQIVPAPAGCTDAERQLMDSTIEMFEEAVEQEMKVQAVDKIFVKLSWD